MPDLPRLRIGICGPASLDLLAYPQGMPPQLPPGHPAPVTSYFVNALLSRGHSVVVFTTSRRLDRPLAIDQGSLAVCVAPRYRPRSVLSFYRRERQGLRALMREYPCDIVHAMWSYEYALAALQSGMPSLVHYRDHAWTIFRQTSDTYRLLRWLLNLYVTMRSDARVANSEYLKKTLKRAGKSIVVVPNFLPSTVTESAASSSEGKQETIVTVSNGFFGRKNVAVALRAFSLLRREFPSHEYRLIGRGMAPGEEAWAYASAQGLTEGVSFVGFLPSQRVLGEIEQASLLLHPATEESFGMTVLEAMAVETPVVAGSSAGNLPDLLESGLSGYLCDIHDPSDIASTVVRALTEAEATTRMVNRARDRVRALYTEEAAIGLLECCYARVLGMPYSDHETCA